MIVVSVLVQVGIVLTVNNLAERDPARPGALSG